MFRMFLLVTALLLSGSAVPPQGPTPLPRPKPDAIQPENAAKPETVAKPDAAAMAAPKAVQGTFKTVLDSDRVRVIEVSLKPGAKSATLALPNRLIYGLTDGTIVFSPPGRTPYELTFKAGEALWLPSQSMGAENDGSKEDRKSTR